MSNVIQRFEGKVPMLDSSSRVPNRVVRQVEGAMHGGLIAAAKVEAEAYTTHVAMQHVAMLSADEAQLARMCPLAYPRLKMLVDQFTLGAVTELQKMVW